MRICKAGSGDGRNSRLGRYALHYGALPLLLLTPRHVAPRDALALPRRRPPGPLEVLEPVAGFREVLGYFRLALVCRLCLIISG